ncbi:(p)ppGpp synthetase [bacterium CG_4_10_14_0_2_um_filter_33_32]|nr:MAG: (p)ppGpp synthetase [bacterium CG10_big_fil_rev_8_21_14_0_10_33_18]PIU76457.1 MAG: (p)ppGpp synthetase [bacterium CG06_land_8_20_14_3_00_33_50]PIW81147.1 MAG: (p)ppGpp synthetase [bacterium CG_4_8_14_3_um_filter_33_28]PIY84895.1 MAG: (p)ppGpp synthetase [bacterium CG_4_10_14_0_8_um_filter_33_57]PIZ86504.1 MAG: (p)ppGpp synthetase [bacterium CG_4_10_14_0_2_um_filter_33_32]PJA72403.1 MAG: (p)ppGpp synthetase [bacterium CG_4_9_14_3_um_filter_33_26]
MAKIYMLSLNIKPSLEGIIEKCKNRPGFNAKCEALIKKAYSFAYKCHLGQKRTNGDPYIVHALATGYYLAELGMDANTIAAGLLHDVPEDTKCNQEEIVNEFGHEIAQIVEGVTRLGGVKYFGKRGRVEDLRKLLLVMAKDLRVIVVKLADRLHNMQTINVLTLAKRKRIATETLEIYSPLASRLGMGEIKGILEDLSFRYYLPHEYKKVVSLVGDNEEERRKYINRVSIEIDKRLKKEGIRASIEGRPKHLYSLYKKLKKYNDDSSKIYDLVAIRIIVNSTGDCYKTLGIIHKDWKPLPQRIKDYIAIPKPSGYRSLHTTIFCLEGKIIEIQIKTRQMHEEAEWGIAAHWHYEIDKESKIIPEKLNWIKELIEWQKDLEASAFMDKLKVDVFKDRIFVFTPKGEVVDLSEEATPIDFAYLIHTDLGNNCVGCKVNGKILPLNSNLHNGDVVEILLSKKSIGPSRDWLRFVKTPLALYNIRRWFKEEDREKYISLGKDLLNFELRKIGKSVERISSKDLELYTRNRPYKNLDSILIAVGRGILSPKQLISQIFLNDEKIFIQKKSLLNRFFPILKNKSRVKHRIKIKGQDGFLMNFASCCKPSQTDQVVGFITRGRGITIHKKDCPNIRKEDKKRLIEVDWDIEKSYEVSIYIEADGNMDILNNLTRFLEELKIGVRNINMKTGKISKINAVLKLQKSSQLKNILERLSNLPNIKLVKRL